jgi:hypothetical protein
LQQAVHALPLPPAYAAPSSASLHVEGTGGKGGKGGKDAEDDADAEPLPLPNLDDVKTDMMTHVDRLKRSLAKLRGGEANPSACPLPSPPPCVFPWGTRATYPAPTQCDCVWG